MCNCQHNLAMIEELVRLEVYNSNAFENLGPIPQWNWFSIPITTCGYMSATFKVPQANKALWDSFCQSDSSSYLSCQSSCLVAAIMTSTNHLTAKTPQQRRPETCPIRTLSHTFTRCLCASSLSSILPTTWSNSPLGDKLTALLLSSPHYHRYDDIITKSTLIPGQTHTVPSLLQDKTSQLSVPDSTCWWITDFLSDRRQHVKMGKHVCEYLTISTKYHPRLSSFPSALLPVKVLHLQPSIC